MSGASVVGTNGLSRPTAPWLRRLMPPGCRDFGAGLHHQRTGPVYGGRQEVTGVVVTVGLAGGDAGSGDAEPLGAGLLGSGVPLDGVGPGVDGDGVGVPDGLGVAVGGGDDGAPVGPGVGGTVGCAVGGLAAVGFGAPAAGRGVVGRGVAGAALGCRTDSVRAT